MVHILPGQSRRTGPGARDRHPGQDPEPGALITVAPELRDGPADGPGADPVVPPMVTVTAPVPVGRLRYAVYPTSLLRGTGFDVRPLLAAPGQGDDPDAALARVRAAFADPRLREAVAQSNPLFHSIAFAPGRALTGDTPYAQLNKRGRKELRTAHRYLRRLLGKTETNAFFGPTLVTRWDPALAEAVRIGEPGAEHRVVGLSTWLVQELADRQRRALAPAARGWGRDPLWQLDGPVLRRSLDGRFLTLSPQAQRVWQALRLPATPARLTALTELPPSDVVDALRLLAPALRAVPQPPATVVDGLGWLRDHPGPAGHRDTELLDRLHVLLEQARTAPWPQSLQLREQLRDEVGAAGLPVERAAGRHYADRDVVNEDRSSPWSDRVRFGRPALRSVHGALNAVLPVLLLDALLRQADAREAVVRATGGRSEGLVDLAARTLEPVTTRRDQLLARLAALVPDGTGTGTGTAERTGSPDTAGSPDRTGDPDGAQDSNAGPAGWPVEVQLSAADLARELAPLWDLVDVRDDDQTAALPGVDLMLAGGPPGTGRWVLSECHDDSSSAIGGITSRVQPGEGREFGHFCDVVGQWLDTSRTATVVGRRRSRHITPELPGLSVELSGTSVKPAWRVVAAADVRVSSDGCALQHDGRRYQLYPGDVGGPLFVALSLPCLVPVPFAADRGYTPRIVVDGVVLQRRRWVVDLPGAGAGGSAERFARPGWTGEHGLPERFFLRHPDEPKPLLVDLGDAFCRDELSRLPAARVVCTEVLPDLDDTWWRAAGPQPAELRIPVFLRWDRR